MFWVGTFGSKFPDPYLKKYSKNYKKWQKSFLPDTTTVQNFKEIESVRYKFLNYCIGLTWNDPIIKIFFLKKIKTYNFRH